MCPKNDKDDHKYLASDCSDRSIDEERRSTSSVPCFEENNMIGYRRDLSADGACEALKKFTKKVNSGEVCVGEIDNKTRVLTRFAGGSFGELYIGELVQEKNSKVAVKVEPQGLGLGACCLLDEGRIYRHLEGGPGIPKIHWFGFHGSEYGALVMDLLGPTLEDRFALCQRPFSLKTLLMLADQMVDTLAHVHSKGFVHRDISPSNCVLGGEGHEHEIYLIDFGHAKKYNETFKVMPRRKYLPVPKAIVGTPRFISVHAHLGHEEGPRNDLESMGYMLIYLARGSLPWQGFKAKNMPEKLKKIADSKMNIPVEKLCKGLPEEFSIFINYTRTLQLYEPPDYQGIKQLFRALAAKHGIDYDNQFDWLDCVPPLLDQDASSAPIQIAEGPSLKTDSFTSTPPSR